MQRKEKVVRVKMAWEQKRRRGSGVCVVFWEGEIKRVR